MTDSGAVDWRGLNRANWDERGPVHLASELYDLARLAAAGARRAGPPPLPPASGDVIEVGRTANASGNVSLGSHMVSAELPLAGQRVTLQLDGPVAHILPGGILARTIACPVPHDARTRLRGARAASSDIRRHKASSYSLDAPPGVT